MSANAKATALLTLCMAMIGVLGYLYFRLQPEPYDETSLCRKSHPLENASVIIVDKTDPFTQEQKNAIRDRIENFKQAVVRHELLTIYVLKKASRANVTEYASPFSLCNPGQWEDGNAAYENLRRLQNRYDTEFDAQFRPLLAELLVSGVAPESPILETLLAATTNKEKAGSAPSKRLLLISDLYEHSAVGTLYTIGRFAYKTREGELPSINKTVTLARMMEYARDRQNGLKGSRLHLVLVRRTERLAQQEQVKVLWLEFFKQIGVEVVKIEAI